MTNPRDPAHPMICDREYDPGLTIREHFAIQAMQGILASLTSSNPDPEFAAERAVLCADALIEALNETRSES